MRKKALARGFYLSLLLVLLLTGCGKKEDDAKISGENNTPVQSGDGAADGTSSMWIKATELIPFEEPEEGYVENTYSYSTLGSKVCLIRTEYPEAGSEQRLCVQIYDSDTKKMEKNVFALELSELEDWYVISMELKAERELSFMLASWDADRYILVRTDLQGTVLEVQDPFPEEDIYPWNRDFPVSLEVFPLSDGRTVIRRWDDDKEASVLTWFDEEAGEQKPLGTLEHEWVKAICCDGEGVLYYYPSGGGIVRWDVEKDVREELIALYREGIMIMAGAAGLNWNAAGELLLYNLEHSKAEIYVLTEEKPANGAEIRLSFLLPPYGEDYLERMMPTFSRENSGFSIVPEGLVDGWNESDYAALRDRIFAELAAGKGPEMMLVSYEDMKLLQEKGLLCDLRDVISEDILKQLIPGVADLGTVNGQLAGITPEIAFGTVVTANETWAADRWSVSEFTELLEEREKWDWPVSFSSTKMSYYTLFWMMFCNDLGHSPFLDQEQGKCCFDSEEFIAILELCKKYGQPDSTQKDGPERARMLKEGDSLALVSYLYGGLQDFSSLMKTFGEDCHIVGFPGGESAGYLCNYSQGYLAVNANAAHREVIGDFLDYLLSYEKQYEVVGTSVRTDVLRDSVIYDEALGSYVMLTSPEPDAPIMEIALKPDGTSYIEDFLDFIESCKPEPDRLAQLAEIIGDELTSCFEGDRSAEATAEIIQRRVQLYLDETAR